LAAGLTIFLIVGGRRPDVPQCRSIQHRIGQKPLQLAILIFKRPQLLGITDIHAAELGFPVVQCRFRDTVLPRQITRLRTRLMLAQNTNDLFFRKPFPLHRPYPFLWAGL
jgi:hypothetical protein